MIRRFYMELWKNLIKTPAYAGILKLVVFVIIMPFVLVACGFVSKSIVAKQEWSENYAREKGVEATSPAMIDGDVTTVGETQPPESTRGAAEYTEAVIKFPEKKAIRRIVIRTPNIQNFNIYAAGKGEDDWVALAEFKNNLEKKVEANVSAVTNQIKIRVRKTSDDAVLPGGRGSRKQLQRARGKIQEVEIYGMVEAAKTEAAPPAGQAVTPGAASAPGGTAAVEAEKPKAPPIAMSLESPKDTYSLPGPVPVKMTISIGADDLVVLADNMTDEMLRTKLLVKSESGAIIPCSKQAPRLSFPKPYRGSAAREISVRNARTLEAESVVTVNIPNLLEFYPIDKLGKYTIQFDGNLEVHDKYLGSAQTQKEDMERTIRDINSRSNYTAAERATLIQNLREEIAQLDKQKGNRYLEVGARGKPLDLVSNVLEIVIQ